MVSEWVRCPVCGNKTRLQIRKDTELKNFPLYCPKCKQESLIEAKDLQVTVVKNHNEKCGAEHKNVFGKELLIGA
ncbi:cysteine-rich KTR domain-containing protein [[Clostridium] spiroforme]|nr:cysteine-rich KTR domain-containing protein [Thomasclavelia spiroformis]MBM6881228.1 cysteine-rich KTR domain-containing protein [Thomasclavelia spiroformis]